MLVLVLVIQESCPSRLVQPIPVVRLHILKRLPQLHQFLDPYHLVVWTTAAAGSSFSNNPSLDSIRCIEIWQGVLQASAPDVATTGNADYLVTAPGGNCVYTYNRDTSGSQIIYDADTGEVTANVF